MSFLGFGQSASVDIVFDGQESRKRASILSEHGGKEQHFLYLDGETVSGKVHVSLKKPGQKLEHQGIKVEFVGQIELYYDRGNHHEFVSLVRELARPGDLTQDGVFSFEFVQVDKPYESYTGSNVRLRYFVRVTIIKRLSDTVKEKDIIVHTLSQYPDMNNSIKMEVGIEDCLHIEFEYNKSKYHLKDVIVGKIYFLLVRIKIKHMEIQIIRRETTGSGPNVFNESDTIAKYEIMDGAPVKGESIPIRLFLAGYELTTTMRDINKKFSVRYFLNLVLVDEEERRYFKQQEIVLFRKADRPSRRGGGGPPQQYSGTQHLVSSKERTPPMHNEHATLASSTAVDGGGIPTSASKQFQRQSTQPDDDGGFQVQRDDRGDDATAPAKGSSEENVSHLNDVSSAVVDQNRDRISPKNKSADPTAPTLNENGKEGGGEENDGPAKESVTNE